MKKTVKTRGILICFVFICAFFGMTLTAHAASYPFVVYTSPMNNKVFKQGQDAKLVFYIFSGDYAYEKYELEVIDSDGRVVATASNSLYVSDVSIINYEEYPYTCILDTSNLNGTYKVHVRAKYYAYGMWLDTPDDGQEWTIKITKPKPFKVKVKNPSVKAKKLKKGNQAISFSKVFKVSGEKGTVKYKKVSGSKKLRISNIGTIYVKHKTKKGTYKIKVKVSDDIHSKTVTVKVKVK